LTRKFVHEAATEAELFRRLLTEPPVPLRSRRPDVPAALEQVVHRALARRPEDRFPDVRALARALQPFA
jgi:serine/threonine-protein kinase